MIRVGVIGLGMMGLTHLDVYRNRDDVQITAIADKDPDRLSGKVRAVGNVEGQAQAGVESIQCKRFEEGKKLIRSKVVDLVDICLPTHMHLDYARAAMRSGKHVMIEKPLARTARDAKKIVAASQKATGFTFVGMCMRFWPGWAWLKTAIDEKRYGNVLSATFQRLASHPGGGFYSNGELCGGALLDLHIHDTDFVQYCFGIPKSVTSVGYKKITSEVDHVVTRYEYDDVPIVVAEGAWTLTAGFPFTMRYLVNFERATAAYDMAQTPPLTLYEPGQPARHVEIPDEMGYDLEIAYFLDCIQRNQKPTQVTLEHAANTVAICEAENKSVTTGRPVKVRV